MKPNREDVLFGWRELLVSLGFTEIMSNSLTKASYAELVADRDLDPAASVHMLNPLSNDLGAMRQSFVFQGLEAIARNTNHKHPDLRLFEFGRTYTEETPGRRGTRYDEQEHLSMWVTGRSFPESWNRPKGKEGQSDLFTLKHAVETLLQRVGLDRGGRPGALGRRFAGRRRFVASPQRQRSGTLGHGSTRGGRGLWGGRACVLG